MSGEVVSNNQYVNGCFAVLHVGGEKDTQSGAVEYHTYDPDGIATLKFEHTMPTRELSLRFVDSNGRAAHFGRIHLWFKVCVTSG